MTKREALSVTNLDLNDAMNSLHKKRCFVQVPSLPEKKNLCSARSIVTCLAKLNMTQNQFKHFTDKRRWFIDKPDYQLGQAKKLLKDVSLPEDRDIMINEFYKFEEYLDIQIIVISSSVLNEVSYKGCCDRPTKIYLYHSNNHFTPIVNIDSLRPRKKLCTNCFVWYSSKTNFHSCSKTCGVCFRNNCEFNLETAFDCPDCNMKVRSQECYDVHKIVSAYQGKIKKKNISDAELKTACETWHRCRDCTKVFNKSTRDVSAHVCGEYFCRSCKKFQVGEHNCWYRIKMPKKISDKFLYIDYEAYQEMRMTCSVEGQDYECSPVVGCLDCPPEGLCSSCRLCIHCKKGYCGQRYFQANLVVSQSSCDVCEKEPWTQDASCFHCGDRCENCFKFTKDKTLVDLCKNSTCGLRQRIFFGDSANDDFCKWLLSSQNNGRIMFAHYGKNFDANFILAYCVSNGIAPDVIYTGSKIQRMHIGQSVGMTILDSYNFLPLKLSQLPKALGLDEQRKKGIYPFRFNSRANKGVVLDHLPDMEYYSPEFMSTDERDDFIKWHRANYHTKFDNDKCLIEYCVNDVIILREACTKFKNLVLEVTRVPGADRERYSPINPFSTCTIASSAMAIFRAAILTEDYELTLIDDSVVHAKLKAGIFTTTDTGEVIDSNQIKSETFLRSSIGQQPGPNGYGRRNSTHSLKCIQYLEYLSWKIGRRLEHSRHKGEKKILNYYVDGWDELNGKKKNEKKTKCSWSSILN